MPVVFWLSVEMKLAGIKFKALYVVPQEVPLVTLGIPVPDGYGIPLIVLQPNPLPVAYVKALEDALHDGIDKPEGVVPVVAPRT